MIDLVDLVEMIDLVGVVELVDLVGVATASRLSTAASSAIRTHSIRAGAMRVCFSTNVM